MVSCIAHNAQRTMLLWWSSFMGKIITCLVSYNLSGLTLNHCVVGLAVTICKIKRAKSSNQWKKMPWIIYNYIFYAVFFCPSLMMALLLTLCERYLPAGILLWGVCWFWCVWFFCTSERHLWAKSVCPPCVFLNECSVVRLYMYVCVWVCVCCGKVCCVVLFSSVSCTMRFSVEFICASLHFVPLTPVWVCLCFSSRSEGKG